MSLQEPKFATGFGGSPTILPLVLAVVLSLSVASPQGEPLAPASSHALTLVSVEVFPEKVDLRGAEPSQRFVVLGTFSDGLQRDVTSRSSFHVDNGEVAKIDGSSRIVGVSEGDARVRVEVEGHTAEAAVHVQDLVQEKTFSFTRDVGSILTKHGCNSSDCHGGVKGQGGFKLSQNSLYPEDDYKWILEGGTFHVLTDKSDEPKVPRIDLKEPEKSLLLMKPTMAVAHGGGPRFALDSRDYRTILGWIQAGAPFGEAADKGTAGIDGVEVFPHKFVLEPGGTQQLVVMAHLSDGRSQDISDQVLYSSINPAVVSVGNDGTVKAVGKGETAIMIRAAGHAVSALAGVITDLIPNYPAVSEKNYIDEYVFAKLRRFNIVPSALSSDAEFLRRVCLDLAGTLPPPNRVREFLTSQDPQKREKLIDTLLDSPEYIDYWTYRFSQLFRVGRLVNGGTTEFNAAYWEWIRDSVIDGKPYDQMARERISAQGWDGPSRHFTRFATENDPTGPQEVMGEQIRLFMGRRLDCAQCHNHPFDSWSQDQFWGLTAFFGSLVQVGWSDETDMVIFDNPAGRDYAWGQPEEVAKVIHPRTKKEVEATLPDGTPLPADRQFDPRMALAEWITGHPHFAEAAVNRIWSYFFGRGIVDPVDDFRSTNPPSHPDLLAALADEFRSQGHDLKKLIRTIVRSRSYQLTSVPNETNRHDTTNYSHFQPRPLDAELFLDAISFVTGVTDEKYLDTTRGHEPVGTRAINLKNWSIDHSQFMEVHGRYDRAGKPNKPGPTLLQALHSFAGRTYNEKLGRKGGRLDRMIRSGRSNEEIVEELYLLAFTRFPSRDELDRLLRLLEESPSRKTTLEDLTWALISSREFAYNH